MCRTTRGFSPGSRNKPPVEGRSHTKQRRVPILPEVAGEGIRTDTHLPARVYQMVPRLPITHREIANLWRHLRQPVRVGPPVELDVESTIGMIGRTGLFLGPVLRPRRRNRIELLLLIDRYGSMAPFAPLVDSLVEGIRRGGLRENLSCWYFHNSPEGYLSSHPGLADKRPLEEVLGAQPRGFRAAIVSDAGAARGTYSRARADDTGACLEVLGRYTYLVAWLNPMPRSRWPRTTAEMVAQRVPMLPIDREGLIDAVNVLRGHPFHPGKAAYVEP